MIDTTLADWLTWWGTVSPGFAFLLALPFLVAAMGLLGDEIQSRRYRR